MRSWLAWMVVVGTAAGMVSACSVAEDVVDEVGDAIDDEPAPMEMPSHPAGDLCRAMLDSLETGEEPSACDEAIVSDCEEVVDTFSRPCLDVVQACVEAGGTPMECLTSATDALTPLPAHHDLAAAYCDECLFDAVDDCEELFFDEESDVGLGSLFVPFSEDVVRDIEEECTSDLTCAVDLVSCAQGVLEERLIPDETALCLLEDALLP